MRRLLGVLALLAVAVVLTVPAPVDSACCYFSAKDKDVLQPAQKAFITWDPAEKVETFTVQPRFEGNALDFGMVIPTPTQPKLHEMPRDFFKHLAVYSIMKKREMPHSQLLPQPVLAVFGRANRLGEAKNEKGAAADPASTRPKVVVLEAGVHDRHAARHHLVAAELVDHRSDASSERVVREGVVRARAARKARRRPGSRSSVASSSHVNQRSARTSAASRWSVASRGATTSAR